MPLSEMAIVEASISIVRAFFSGMTDGIQQEIGGKLVNLFHRKLIGGFDRERISNEEELQNEILSKLINDHEFKRELNKLVNDYQSRINNIYQSGNSGTTIGINNVQGDQFFR